MFGPLGANQPRLIDLEAKQLETNLLVNSTVLICTGINLGKFCNIQFKTKMQSCHRVLNNIILFTSMGLHLYNNNN